MVFYTRKLAHSIVDLLKDIHDLKYGEVKDVEITEEGGEEIFELSPQQRSFVELIETGIVFFEMIKVREGQPVYAESPVTTPRLKLKAIKTYRFE